MIPLINSALAMVIALTVLLEMLALPFVGLWIILSIRRSLARIADSLSRTADVSEAFRKELDDVEAEHCDGSRPGIFNSMFGR